jgi:diacylglycerol kinase (ATP)
LDERAPMAGPSPGRGPKLRRPKRARRALFLANPHARGGDGVDFTAVRDRLAGSGIAAEQATPEDAAAAGGLVRERGADVDFFIVGGGDGTLSKLVPPLLTVDNPVAVLPLGTANDFARSIGIPLDLEGALRTVEAGYVRRVDVGFVNERPFLNVATIGLAAHVARHHVGWRKRMLGVASYPISWIKAWKDAKPFRARVIADDTEAVMRCSQIAVGNGRHYGGGMTVAEDASHDDGLFHVYCVGPVGAWSWLRLLPALRSGTYAPSPAVRRLTARSVVIETRRAEVINVDGEISGSTPATFRIAERALRVVAPPLLREAR